MSRRRSDRACGLAWAHVILACSLGGTSMSATQRRIAESGWDPLTATPTMASRAEPDQRGPCDQRGGLELGPVLRSSV